MKRGWGGAEAKDDEDDEEKEKGLQEQQLKEYIFIYVVCGSVVSRFSVSVCPPPYSSPSPLSILLCLACGCIPNSSQ